MCMEVKRNLAGFSSFFPPCGFHGSNSGYQVWLQAYLFTHWVISLAHIFICCNTKKKKVFLLLFTRAMANMETLLFINESC